MKKFFTIGAIFLGLVTCTVFSVNNQQQKEIVRDCVICLEQITKKNIRVKLPCHKQHQYHFDCMVREVFNGKRMQCPLCRIKFCDKDCQRIRQLSLDTNLDTMPEILLEPVEVSEYFLLRLDNFFGRDTMVKRVIGFYCTLVLFFDVCIYLSGFVKK